MPSRISNSKFSPIIQNSKFGFLLFTLLMFIVFLPAFEHSPSRHTLFKVIFSLIFVALVLTISESRQTIIVAVMLFLPSIFGTWFTETTIGNFMSWLALFCQVIFLILTLCLILCHVLKTKLVTLDIILGSICGYLLLGLLWAILYSLLTIFCPESFNFNLPPEIFDFPTTAKFKMLPSFNYFSFVSLTTLGYGDITPVTGLAQSLSTLEAITGQFYIAVLVARLVGLQISQSMNKQ